MVVEARVVRARLRRERHRLDSRPDLDDELIERFAARFERRHAAELAPTLYLDVELLGVGLAVERP